MAAPGRDRLAEAVIMTSFQQDQLWRWSNSMSWRGGYKKDESLMIKNMRDHAHRIIRWWEVLREMNI